MGARYKGLYLKSPVKVLEKAEGECEGSMSYTVHSGTAWSNSESLSEKERGQKVKGWAKRRKRVRTDLAPMNSLELPLLPQTEHRINRSPSLIKRRKVSHQLISVWTKTPRVKGNPGGDHGFTGKPREVSIRCKTMGSSIHAQTHTEKVVGVAAHASEAGAKETQELQERACS